MPRRSKGETNPVSYFRLYSPNLVRNIKIRAVELDRYLQDCWQEAIHDWLRKTKHSSTGAASEGDPKLVGIRVDPELIQKFKVQATREDRTHGDCLEEAGQDWLMKHRASGKEKQNG